MSEINSAISNQQKKESSDSLPPMEIEVKETKSFVDMPEDIWGTLRQQPRLIWVILIAAGGGFLFGNDIGYIGPILGFESFQATFSDNEPITPSQDALIVGTFSIGAILGALPWVSAFCCERLGRKWAIFIGCLIFLAGAIIQAASTTFWVFYIGRIVDGFSIGILSVVVPIYQTEIAPVHIRGAIVSTYQLAITFGILVANLCDWAVEDSPDWWLAMIPQIVFSAVLAILVLFVPESPRYLLLKGKDDLAEKSLNQLRSGAPQAAIDSELHQMKKTTDIEKELGQATFREIFCDPFILKVLCVGCIIQLGQQFTGINALMYFGPTIFKSAGVDAIVFQVIQASVNFFCTFPAIYAVDKFGRKFLFLIGAIGMTICLFIVGGAGSGSLQFPENCFNDEYRSQNRVACATSNGSDFFECPVTSDFTWQDRTEFTDECPVTGDLPDGPFTATFTPDVCACGAEVDTWFTTVMISFLFVYIFFFASGWGPIAWVYCGEIFPNRYRSKCVSMTTLSNWVGNAGIAFMTPVLLDGIQFYTFIIFASCNAFLIAYSAWLPETKDLPLEKVIGKFEDKFGEWKNKNEDEVKQIEA